MLRLPTPICLSLLLVGLLPAAAAARSASSGDEREAPGLIAEPPGPSAPAAAGTQNDSDAALVDPAPATLSSGSAATVAEDTDDGLAKQERRDDDPPEHQRSAAEDDDTDDDAGEIQWTLRDGRRLPRSFPLTASVGIWPNTFSLGLMAAAPVLPRGFIHGINDSFALEFGLVAAAVRSDYYWSDGVTGWQLWPAFGGRWDFFLTRRWSSFITLKLIGQIPLSGPSSDWFNVLAGAGVHYRLSNAVSMRIELNFPQGLNFGLAFPLGYSRGPTQERYVAALAPTGYKSGP